MLFVHTFNKSRGARYIAINCSKLIKDRKINVVIVAIGRSG